VQVRAGGPARRVDLALLHRMQATDRAAPAG
jgi:hypothetical protein